MRVKEIIIMCLSLLVVGVRLQAVDFANQLADCVVGNDLNFCLRQTLDDLRKLMPIGIPELGLRRSEPLEIDNLEFRSDPGPVKVNATFSRVVVRGLSNFTVNKLDADVDTQTLRLSLTVPLMHINGLYNLDGRVFVIDVKGSGDFVSFLEGVTGVGQARILPVGPPSNQRLSIVDTDFDFHIRRTKVRMHNLFGGKYPPLARHVNHWISDNSDLVINAVKPQIKRETINIMGKVLNDAFSKIPAQQFISTLSRNFRHERQ